MAWIGPDRLPIDVEIKREGQNGAWVLQVNSPRSWGEASFSPLYRLKEALANGVEIWASTDGRSLIATEELEDGQFFMLGIWLRPQSGSQQGEGRQYGILEGDTDDFMSMEEFYYHLEEVGGHVLCDLPSTLPTPSGPAGDYPPDLVPPEDARPNTSTLLPLDEYDIFLISFSGGKDSMACVLHLLDLGVPKEKIELWHQCIDGDPEVVRGEGHLLMDWPITPAFCEAFATAMELPLLYQWKEGGFHRELMLNNEFGGEIVFDDGEGGIIQTRRSSRARRRTRLKFPPPTGDLRIRWCSPYLKIDVASRSITNSPRLAKKKILYITGERRQESPGTRGKYAEIEKHRTSTGRRRVDHWRPIINWHEGRVWDIIRRYGVIPHPCYFLGWARCSCIACIFGDKDQWASLREIHPDLFNLIVYLERSFHYTINMRGKPVTELADAGEPFTTREEAEASGALTHQYRSPILTDPLSWVLPAGAYKRGGGPT